jgi:phosphate starvation-inducible PhoH-like protein
MDALVGIDTQEREKINSVIEIAPLAYLRGRTFKNSICILDEAQNCTKAQIILFLTRLGEDSKIIVTADPTQSDLSGSPYIGEAIKLLESVPGIGMMQFTEEQIVRHPLVGKILEKLK